MIRKQVMIIISTLLLGICATAMDSEPEPEGLESEREERTSARMLPIELIYNIAKDMIKASKTFNEAIENFNKFRTSILKAQNIDLLREDYAKEDIINLFGAKFKTPPIIIAKELGMSEEFKKKVKEQAIFRILDRNNITDDELKAWFELNKDKVNKAFTKYIRIILLPLKQGAIRKIIVAMSAALLYGNADPNISDRSGRTALMAAAYNGHKEIVLLLLNANADPNIEDENGETALFNAVFRGEKEIVELLLNANADPHVQDENGKTALYVAAGRAFRDADIVKLLLNAKVDPNIKNLSGDTALMKAVRHGEKDIVQALLNAKADPNAQTKEGYTALMMAVRKKGYKEIVELLLKAHSDPNIENKNGETAFMLAKTEDIKNLLKEYGAK